MSDRPNQAKSPPPAGEHDNSLPARIRRLPNSPGVYLFKDRSGTVLYFGKAKALRSRVR
jgi:excinuclease ABC subunit C